MAKFHTWGEFNLEKKEVPMTHAEMPPRGHIPAYGVRNLAEGREVEIYPTALPHEPFNTVEYLSVQESQAREARAREEGRKEAFLEAAAIFNEEAEKIKATETKDVVHKGIAYVGQRGAAMMCEKLAAASRSGEGEKADC